MQYIDDLESFLSTYPESGMHNIFFVKPLQLINYRKRKRTIRNALGRKICKCKNYIADFYSEFNDRDSISGKENYEFLTKSIRMHGWIPDYPARLLYKKDKWVLKNGHHRLHIACELDLDYVPVIFY